MSHKHTHTHIVSEDESLLVARRLLVFINPVGGQGKGVSDFKQYVQPLFDMAEINCNIIVTGKPYTIEELIITACGLPCLYIYEYILLVGESGNDYCYLVI